MQRSFSIILLLNILFLFSFSQTPEKNLEKYNFYRERVKYFYKLGENPGECQYASISGMSNSKKLNFGGDQTIEMAWFIGVMATEYKLIEHNKQDVDRTLRDLYYALLAYRRLDECEDKEPWIDAYDAAAWTSIMHLSRQSIDKNGAPVEIPDFTGGRWKDPDWRKGRMA